MTDPAKFFDAYPRFLESSETGPWLDRLNARYFALIHQNRHLLEGARVLDLACHDGRFSFAALQNGARHVVGIDFKAHLVDAATGHLGAYGVTPDRYTFLAGDMFDYLEQERDFDVVLCFGILYHINEHMRLFDQIAASSPRAILVDTRVSTLDGAVIELLSPLGKSPPEPGNAVEGHPTRAAFDAMFSSFGWQVQYFDWLASGLCGDARMYDYRTGERVSAVIECPEYAVPAEARHAAVQEVLDKEAERENLFMLVANVARRHDISPQALRTWVNQAQRRRTREAGFKG
ncbi:MAG: methyltransferase domain-containing protein [Halioglobus sp.]|nr:methyltransferase domain-containing protein [Halioglobus sp.]